MIFRILVILILLSGTAYASNVTHPNEDFVAGQPAVADQVDANFDASEVAIDDNDERITELEAVTPILAADIDTATELNALTTDTDMVLDTDIGSTVQGFDADLTDLADGTLTGSKVGTGIAGDNITDGSIDSSETDSSIAETADLVLFTYGTGIGTGTCTTGRALHLETDDGFLWGCTGTDTWSNLTTP